MTYIVKTQTDPFPHIVESTVVHKSHRTIGMLERAGRRLFDYNHHKHTGEIYVSIVWTVVLVVNFDESGNAFDWALYEGYNNSSAPIDWALWTVSDNGDKMNFEQAIEFLRHRDISIEAPYRS